MNESQEYLLRWRGRQSGPHPVPEINRMLDEHEIGMGHEILYQDEWISLERFFSKLKKAALPAMDAPKPAVSTVAPSPPQAASPAVESGPGTPIRVRVVAEPPAHDAAPGPSASRPKNRLLFALLAVFAGFTGAHNFYARQWMTGLLQLLLSVATSLMGFGILASWLWAVVEAFATRKDADGTDMI
jgi:TM2 domain-containing membrane protein YozV